VATILTPSRRRGRELLDDPAIDPRIVRRSLSDVALSNRLFGGTWAVIAELNDALDDIGSDASLLDVGCGIGDIVERSGNTARARGVCLTTCAMDRAETLVRAARSRAAMAVCGNALALPFADGAFDIVTCSQTLHHFADSEAAVVLQELNRVARVRVIISDLRRSWFAAGGLWLASFPLRFHPVSRHDGVVSVLRGYTPNELVGTVERAVHCTPTVRRRIGFRITASWRPVVA
jgi:SAM-dependent methyltransferase